jgi:hypothetical protein
MMHGIDIHSPDPLSSELQPECLIRIIDVQLVLFRVASKQFRLSDDIIPVVN